MGAGNAQTFLGLVFVLWFCFPCCADLQAAPENSLEERIKTLEKTIQMQQELLDAQQQMLETLKGEVNSQKQADQENETRYQERIKGLESKFDENKKTFFGPLLKPKAFNVTGRIQFRYQAINDNGDDPTLAANQNAFDREGNDGFMIRRMRLHFFGDVTDRWSWMVQISGDGDTNEDKVDPDRADYRLAKDEVGREGSRRRYLLPSPSVLQYYLRPVQEPIFPCISNLRPGLTAVRTAPCCR